ncbi:hydroxyisourate hydrolase [Kordiimonas sp.]|uniref:hydroxyisourate hydrolase n=1 Tax=Kordiimonas sp. TaxID=1970157 RepID=UPI003A93929E
MGRLTTHVLDTANGCPGEGIQIRLYRLAEDGSEQLLCEAVTNDDGRVDGPILEGADFTVGTYLLEFAAGDYFRARGTMLPELAFLDVVPIRFGLADAGAHYHVPLLISPYGYSTYRGS